MEEVQRVKGLPLLLFALVIISGCTAQEVSKPEQGGEYQAAPSNLSFRVFEGGYDEGYLKFHFTFTDQRAYDGEVYFTLQDEAGKTLYSRNLPAAAEDYVDIAECTPEFCDVEKAYELRFPLSELKGREGDYMAFIRFTFPHGQTLTAEATLRILEGEAEAGWVTSETAFGIEEVSYQDIAQDMPGWFDAAAERGISLVGVDAIDLEGYIIFDSPTLRGAGFREDPDYGLMLPEILREAKKRDIKIIVMLEGIAHIISDFYPYSDSIDKKKLTPKAVAQVVRELGEEAKKTGVEIAITEEAFEDEYIDAISRAARESGVWYIHFFEDLGCRADLFLSEDYAYYPYDARNNPADQEYMRSLLKVGSYYGELGNLNVMYGAARGCGIGAGTLTAGGWGLGPRTHQNIALLRAVQYGPKQFFFVIGEGDEGPIYEEEVPYVQGYNFKESLLPLIEEFGRKETDTPKPIANLIIDEPKGGEELTDFFTNAQISSMAAVTNAMLAAGYDIVVTRSRPYDNARLYYVFSPGMIFEEVSDLPAELAALAEGNTPVFYQAAGGLPDTMNWNKVKDALGIDADIQALVNEDDASFFDPIPEKVVYEFPSGMHEVRYGGISLETWYPEQAGRFSLGHYLHFIEPGNVDGEVLVAGKTSKDGDGVFDDETALIVRKGNVFFVNGGYLHLDASHVLANIMSELAGKGPVYDKPSYGYFTNGESRAVFFAPYDVDVDINVYGGSRVTEFDEEGRTIEPGVRLEEGRLKGKVKRFHLVIVD